MIKVLLPEVDLGDPLFYGENVSWSFGGEKLDNLVDVISTTILCIFTLNVYLHWILYRCRCTFAFFVFCWVKQKGIVFEECSLVEPWDLSCGF